MPPWPSWTIKDAARETGYHPEYLRELCRVGKIEHVKAGQMFLIRIESLQDYIANLPDNLRTGPRRGK